LLLFIANSPDICEIANKKIQELSLSDNIVVIHGNIHEMAAEDLDALKPNILYTSGAVNDTFTVKLIALAASCGIKHFFCNEKHVKGAIDLGILTITNPRSTFFCKGYLSGDDAKISCPRDIYRIDTTNMVKLDYLSLKVLYFYYIYHIII
jgi:hypothetical protein